MPKKTTELVVAPDGKLSIEQLIAKAIEKGTPVGTMERLLVMRDKLKAEFAQEQYNLAMANFQAECPTIKKTKEVKVDGSVVYSYAPIESIVEQVKTYLQKNGFSYSSTMELLDTGVRVTVRVTHVDGHSEINEMTVPLGNKTNIMSASQQTAAAQTFAKRYAFCNAFGILTGDEDNDGKKTPSDTPQPQLPNSDPVEPGLVTPAAPDPNDQVASISVGQQTLIRTLVTKHREDGSQYQTAEEFEKESGLRIHDLSFNQAQALIDKLLQRVREIEAARKDKDKK